MTRITFRLVTVLVCVAFGSSLSHAQNEHSFVSGVGSDANPCTRAAPCQTFAGAIPKTVPNGEIDALDTAHYAQATIDRSITIDGTGTVAGAFSFQIIVGPSASPGDAIHTVRLRGLSFNGAVNNAQQNVSGLIVGNGALNYTDLKVYVEDTVIEGYGRYGILYLGDGGNLIVTNSTIRNNRLAGIRVDSNNDAASTTITNVTIDHTATNGNQEGVRFEDNVRGTITNSISSNNSLNGYTVFPTSQASTMNIKNSTAAQNKQYGVISITSGAATGTIRISNMEITDNVVGGLKTYTGGQICSNGRNSITAPTDPPNCAFTDQ